MAAQETGTSHRLTCSPARLGSDGEASMSEDEAADSITFLETDLLEDCEVLPWSGTLGPAELSWIRRELREHYDSILREPVPERLLTLLDQGLARRTFH
jgi:hypothetical protein